MKRLTTLAVIVLFVISGTVFALPQKTGGKIQPMMPWLKIKTQLNLTKDQEQKFNDIIFSQQEAMIDNRAEIQKLRLQKQKIALSDNPDLTKLKKINSKIFELLSQNSNRRLETWAKINAILTPEQQVIWKRTLNRFNAGMRKARKGCFGRKIGMNMKMQ